MPCRRIVAPVCRLWEELVRQQQTRLVLCSTDLQTTAWEARFALGPALTRRPGLRELHTILQGYVRAENGFFQPTLSNMEDEELMPDPADAELLAFVAGRMLALELLCLCLSPTPGEDSPFFRTLPMWSDCLRHQLRSLEVKPVGEFLGDVATLTRLTRLALSIGVARFELPADATALRQLQDLSLDCSDVAARYDNGEGTSMPGVQHFSGLRALRSVHIRVAALPDLAWLQVGGWVSGWVGGWAAAAGA